MPNDLEKRIQAARAKILGEMPNIKPVDVSPSSGMLDKLNFGMRKGAVALTNPITGNITYDPSMIQDWNDDQINNLLTHEMTHAGQVQQMPMLKRFTSLVTPRNTNPPAGMHGPFDNNYFWDPDEMQAFQAERDRAVKNHMSIQDPVYGSYDIPLPSPKTRKKMGVQ